MPLLVEPDTCSVREDNGVIGRLVAGVGGLALGVSVFLTWYSLNLGDVLRGVATRLPAQLAGQLSGALGSVGGLTLTWSGWNAVHTIRFVLLLIGFAVVVSSLASSTGPTNRQAWLVLAGGLLAGVLAAYRIESPPSALEISIGPFQVPLPAGTGAALSRLLHVQAGAWVALLGAGLVMIGGWAQLGSGQTVSSVRAPTYPTASASQPPPGSLV
jgi:hypothetical protein